MRKKIIKVVYVAAVIAAIAVISGGWYYFFGPAGQARVDQAIALDVKARADVDRAIAAAKKMPEAWSGLSFDETTEADIILSAIGSYRVEEIHGPAATKIKSDIAAASKDLKKAQANLEIAAGKITATKRMMLPGTERQKLATAEKKNAAVMTETKKCLAGLTEMQYDNYVWGFFANAVDRDAAILVELDAAYNLIKAGDHDGAKERVAAAKTHSDESLSWATMGNLKLTSIRVNAKDGEDLLKFVLLSKDITCAFDQATSAIIYNNPTAFERTAEQIGQKLKELRTFADGHTIGQGYVAWYLANGKRWL